MDLTEAVLTPVRDLGSFIRDQRLAARISVRQLARQAGVSIPYLSQLEPGLRKPSADMLAQIAHGLQISAETLLTKAGILEAPASPPVPVEVAIGADPALTDRQKASLVEVYRAFRRPARQVAGGGRRCGRLGAEVRSGCPGEDPAARRRAAGEARGVARVAHA